VEQFDQMLKDANDVEIVEFQLACLYIDLSQVLCLDIVDFGSVREQLMTISTAYQETGL